MNRLKLTIALAAMAIFTTNAHASLIGDSIRIDAINSSNVVTHTATATVGAGVEFTSSNFSLLFLGETIDLTSNAINLSFIGGIQRTFRISDIDTPVTSATSSSSTISNIAFTSSSVSFLYIGANASTGTLNLTFESANNSQIPEPGTTALLVSGLAGIFLYRRKR